MDGLALTVERPMLALDKTNHSMMSSARNKIASGDDDVRFRG
jgi:hypothetical protein